MGSIRPSNIKRIAEEIVDNNPGIFNEDFENNKKILSEMLKNSVTKKTMNAIAGYVTRYILKKKSKEKSEMEQLGLA
ncbi:30S ribosomal protein S17e [Picrophilus oshimae]|uniref:Small ribosomal subunit protein eS17 n=2 Tax=Picrophilus torridus (strain ATCC 700027 / DSM 9790 / JCM 10055 / NBRC 100828 / KAW 2/3) TaxID=1122961 RepID=RS17E_PICTO|nr:30S ribosomal protein S17e [Picrophilus oshimae]Q6L0U7.1 RecName: Full=Small ribosomal subunit protein eS17; AltName: Full=30S ribosomal protein S17e [Picrophilus oshimae DSM 9789]AAT43405.1 small subunit ribosomal protein S17E [Picrophilus oshimae DSM 9789]SMD30285.1 SSU ribosomal protein S17E [Picrophilus oshimae DSM 9789]